MGRRDPGLERLREELIQEFRGSETRTREHLDATEARMREHVDATAAQTRRHFDVVSEGLMAKIELVAEGLGVLDDKMERFRAEVHESFARVDRRFLNLETRVSSMERR